MDKSKVVKEAVEKAERDAPDAGLAGRHPRVVVVTRTGDIVCGLPRMSAPEDVASGDAEFARADFLAAALSRAVDAAYDAGKAEAHARAAREETATLAALADANEWEVRAKAAEKRAGRAEAALRDIVDNGGDRGGRIAAEALAGLKGDAAGGVG